MEDDDWDETDDHAVIVPVSLIHDLTKAILVTIDGWHEARQIHNLDTKKCAVAMIASFEAAMESLHSYPDGETLQ